MVRRGKHARWLSTGVAGVMLWAMLSSMIEAGPAAALNGPFAIDGSVLLADTGGSTLPGAGVQATLFALTGDSMTAGMGSSSADSTSTGEYSFTGLPAGTYRIYFEMTDRTNPHAPAWLGSTPFESASTIIRISSASVHVMGTVLNRESTLVGHVNASPALLAGYHAAVSAELYNPVSHQYETRSRGFIGVQADGTYRLGQLNAGEYRLRFFDPYTDNPQLATRYWPDTTYAGQAQRVVLAAQEHRSGYDVAMVAWSSSRLRIGGADRFETAVLVSQAFFAAGHTPVVYIANGLDYPDALSGSAAAAHDGGPLLLVSPNQLDPRVASEISRLLPARIVVLGGVNAVGESVYGALASLVQPGAIRRISGADRYATSRAIATTSFGAGAVSAFIATGRNFPDALVAGAAAGRAGAPLILVDGLAAGLDGDTTTVLTELSPRSIRIAGGLNSVSAGVEAGLAAVPGVETMVRYGGVDRYQTAVLMSGSEADTAFLAIGTGYADALAGGAAAGALGVPVYLARPDCVPPDVLSYSGSLGVHTFVILGGPAALSDDVMVLTVCR